MDSCSLAISDMGEPVRFGFAFSGAKLSREIIDFDTDLSISVRLGGRGGFESIRKNTLAVLPSRFRPQRTREAS